MDTRIVKEGDALIEAETADVVSREQETFYNPQMEGNRTLSIRVLQAIGRTGMKIALPLAGTGIRAIRILKELDSDKVSVVKANDLKREATRQIERNIERNDIDPKRISVTTLDGNEFLKGEKGFDYVDIDPFGSPNIVLHEAIMHTAKDGILAVTATDTAALAGTYPQACKQKYWAESSLMPQQHEMGLRILARKAIMTAMHYTKRLEPILAYHNKHYYRIFFKVDKGKAKAARAYDHIKAYFKHCPGCGYHETGEDPHATCPHCEASMKRTGPLYDGTLNDKNFLEAIKELLETEDKENTTIVKELSEQERVDRVGFYDTHQVAKANKLRLHKVARVIDRLNEKGYDAVRPREVRTGVRTNAPFEELKKILVAKEDR